MVFNFFLYVTDLPDDCGCKFIKINLAEDLENFVSTLNLKILLFFVCLNYY